MSSDSSDESIIFDLIVLNVSSKFNYGLEERKFNC